MEEHQQLSNTSPLSMSISSGSEPLLDVDMSRRVIHLGDLASTENSLEDDSTAVPHRPSEGPTSPPVHLATPGESSDIETQQLDQSTALKEALENIVKAQEILEQVQVTTGIESQNIATSDKVGSASVLPPEVTPQSQNEGLKSTTGSPLSDVPDDAVDTFWSSCRSSDDRTKTIDSAEVWFSAQDRTSPPIAVDVESKDLPEEPSIPENITPVQPSGLTTQPDDALLDAEWDDEIDNEIIIPSAPSQQDTVMWDAPTLSPFPTSSSSVTQIGDGLDLFQNAFDNALDELKTENQAKRPCHPISNNIISPSSGAEIEERRGINDFVDPYPKDPWEPYWKKRAETKEQFIARFTNNVRQMMYVSGETGEPSVETTSIIEDIVRQQVISMVSYYHPL